MTESAAIWEDIDSLVPWGDNPRINDHAVENVANSIKRFGFASPIVARLADKMVIAGHTRLMAARSLGLDRVPVRYLDIDPADAKMLALADNKIGEIAEWSDDLLQSVLEDLEGSGDDISGLGWTDLQLEAILDEKIDYSGDDDFSDESNQEVSADVRQVVLWFTPEEHETFLSCVQALSKRLGTENQSTTILEALRNA
jgi:hypothetical protein